MNQQEILKKLQEAGIPTDGTWRKTTERENTSSLLENQAKLLKKLEGLLEMQIQNDKATLADLQVKLSRIKHGGGN